MKKQAKQGIDGIFQTKCNACGKLIIMHFSGGKWSPLDYPSPRDKQFTKHYCPARNSIMWSEEDAE